MKIKGIMRAALMLIVLLVPVSSFSSINVSIGGNAWYIWWDPAWAKAKMLDRLAPNPSIGTPYMAFKSDGKNFKPSGSFMAGPSLAIGFLKRWSISEVFLAGKYTHRATGPVYQHKLITSPLVYDVEDTFLTYCRRSMKMESDTSISCAVHKYIKVYAGFKYQGYTYKEQMKNYDVNNYVYRDLADKVRQYGAGLGLGFTVPLGTSFFLSINVSSIALWGIEEVSLNKTFFIYPTGINLYPFIFKKGKFFSYGCTTSLALMYYIKQLKTTISIGGRYQLLFYRQRYDNILDNDVAMNIINKEYDHFYGITVSMIYTFYIGKKSLSG